MKNFLIRLALCPYQIIRGIIGITINEIMCIFKARTMIVHCEGFVCEFMTLIPSFSDKSFYKQQGE